jgi:hypothetical protein
MNATSIIPNSLKEKIKKDEVAIFVGSGISKSVGYPDWKSLTIDILKDISEREPKADGYINALLQNLFEPIEIIGKISEQRNFVVESLDKIFKAHKDIQPSDLHKKILQLSNYIVTSNYDELLEQANQSFEKITYSNSYKISKLNQYPKYVFKLHGDIDEPDKCILFPDDYDKLYNNPDSSIFEFLKLISNKSFLFVGFSLSDPYVKYLFKYIENIYNGFSPEHYIISVEQLDIELNRVTNIRIPDYSELDNILDELITQKETIGSNSIEVVLEENSNLFQPIHHSYSDFDLPPNIKHWVGRKRELENIANDNFRVVFVTGIGGQGKSALVSYYLKEKFDSELYEFGDWRDFKEETNRFQTKLISIIKRLSKESVFASDLETASNQELVDIFFQHLEQRKIVFVFDNIDSYIDLETFLPVGGFGILFRAAIERNHNSKFIFTCRPFIKAAYVSFYQIQLDGLKPNETVELFANYNPPMTQDNLDVFCQKAHKLTKGHPLWLNLIAAQTLRGENIAEDFILGLEKRTDFAEENFSAILSQNILTKVWHSLNYKQQYLIRAIAETVKSETIANLKKILDKEFNNNQFDRALKTLKNLNLIETKDAYKEEEIELHPLVREFVLTKFQKSERAKFITLLVKFYDGFIYVLKPTLSAKLPLSALQNWTLKIELQINKSDFKSALIVLREVYSTLLSAGYFEEYIRVADMLYKQIDWSAAIENEYPYFHQLLLELCEKLAHFQKYEECDFYLEKYQTFIPGKSNYYLSLLSVQCYISWLKEESDAAIKFGEEGEYLLAESKVQDSFDLRHNLALARRDSKSQENLLKALDYFSQNEDVEEIIQSDKIKTELGGHYYGNVGRCFEYLKNNKNAFRCYIIAIKILMNSEHYNAKKNIGYGCDWVSSLLIMEKQYKDAAFFMRYGLNTWSLTSTVLYNRLLIKWESLKEIDPTVEQTENIAEWQIEKKVKDYISSFLN